MWDFEEADGEDWTVIKHAERVVWRELAYWEGGQRFNEVKDVLKAHYAERFVSLQPTAVSELYLYGDSMSAPSQLEPS